MIIYFQLQSYCDQLNECEVYSSCLSTTTKNDKVHILLYNYRLFRVMRVYLSLYPIQIIHFCYYTIFEHAGAVADNKRGKLSRVYHPG